VPYNRCRFNVDLNIESVSYIEDMPEMWSLVLNIPRMQHTYSQGIIVKNLQPYTASYNIS